MRTLPCAFRVAALVALGSLLPAGEDDWYVQVGAGLTTLADSQGAPVADIEYEEGFELNAAIGRRLFSIGDAAGLSIEIEAYHSDNEVQNDGLLAFGSSSAEDLTVLAFFVNGIVDWRWSARASLYGGVGIGYAPTVELASFSDSVDGNEFDTEDGAVAFQGKLGIRYDLGGPLSWFLGYRFLALDDVKYTDPFLSQSFDLETTEHAFEVGFRWGIR